MPLIEFICTKCKRRFEKLVDISSNRAHIVCPDCGGTVVQNFSGVCYGKIGKNSGGCNGNCGGGCSGCHG